MKLFNTSSRLIEEFQPLNSPSVTFYACGPTVYDYTHIGHLRTYTHNDLLRRTLMYNGFNTKYVMNITDVGHLTGDDDTGEDKLEKGAKKFGKTVEDVAQYFTDFFFASTDALRILRPDIVVEATKHIADMISLISKLQQRGFVYETDEAMYFDTTKFDKYGALSGQNLADKMQKAREDVYIDSQKKHATDFVLWFKRVGRFKDHTMYWNSPWGDGFPGWHIECSAMSMKYLGETIDIHAGGVDHIPVHHENEIAQSECATEKTFVKYWFHSEFLKINGEKMSKSKGNLYTLDHLSEKNIDPLALRYLYLQTHYRQVMNFTWESLQAAQTALNKLKDSTLQLRQQTHRKELSDEKLNKVEEYSRSFKESISHDLQMPKALSTVWEVVKSNIPSNDKLELLYDFDHILGFGLPELNNDDIPHEIIELAENRKKLRASNDFKTADQIRSDIEERGYHLEDINGAYRIKKKPAS